MNVLKPAAVCRMLGVSRSWLYAAAQDGRIPCIRSANLAGALAAFEDAPWGDLYGEPLDQRVLAKRLAPNHVTQDPDDGLALSVQPSDEAAADAACSANPSAHIEAMAVAPPARCHSCGSNDWWTSTCGKRRCRKFHPPTPGAEALSPSAVSVPDAFRLAEGA
jgi:hypothetical protein